MTSNGSNKSQARVTPTRTPDSMSTKLTSQKIGDSNIFTYNLGDGKKYMKNTTPYHFATEGDTLKFGKNISKEDLHFSRVNTDDLRITIGADKGNHLTVKYFFSEGDSRLHKRAFNKIEVEGYTVDIDSILPDIQPEWRPMTFSERVTSLLSTTIGFEAATLRDQLADAMTATLPDTCGQGEQPILYGPTQIPYCVPSFGSNSRNK